jgi:hypothetical protein
MSHENGGRTHPHENQHQTVEDYSSRKHPEFVVLDIGEDVGALIVHADADMHGIEIEISPAGDDGRRAHKQVLERDIGHRPAFTAVFDGLAGGAYTLWIEGRPRARGVSVEASAVAELDWRAAAGRAPTAAAPRER